ncbi:MAG: lipopolysaccharide biosynthesis protein [Pseudomonadota bacterium]
MLKQRALTATIWSGADIFLRQGLQLAVAIALARLLSPNDFGIVALLALFTGIATVLVDGGFSAALIQNQNVDHADESTVFWFNLAIGVAAAIAMLFIAPLAAAFYSQPVLVPLMGLMALNVILGSLGAIHRTLLTKQLNFRLQMLIGVVAAVVSGAVAIGMARNGFGVWALAVQIVVMTAVSTTLSWWWHHWRPRLVWSAASVRKLFGFGGYHLGSSLLDIVYIRLYTMLIGRLYSPRELGFYNNADTTAQLPGGFLTGVLARVALPMFSVSSNDSAKLRRGMQLSVRGMMLLNAPMMLGMAAVTEPLTRTLFGSQWLPAVPILRVLCLAGVLLPLHVINLNVLLAQGHSRLMFRLEMTKKVVGVTFICAGAFFGVMGIAWSQVAFSAVAFIINAHYSQRYLTYGVFAQLRDFLPGLCVSVVMAGFVYVTSTSTRWKAAPAVELLVLVSAGSVFFLAGVWLLRLKALHDVIALFRPSHLSASAP